MKDRKDQRAITGSFLVENDVPLASGHAQIRPVFENHFRSGFSTPNRFKVCVEEADVADRLIGVPCFDSVEDDPGDVAIGQMG